MNYQKCFRLFILFFQYSQKKASRMTRWSITTCNLLISNTEKVKNHFFKILKCWILKIHFWNLRLKIPFPIRTAALTIPNSFPGTIFQNYQFKNKPFLIYFLIIKNSLCSLRLCYNSIIVLPSETCTDQLWETIMGEQDYWK